jgi:hypothetical protein
MTRTMRIAPCTNCKRDRPVAAHEACGRCYRYFLRHKVWPPPDLLYSPEPLTEIKISVSSEDVEILDGLAAAEGRTRPSVIRTAIAELIKRRTT